MDKLKMQSMNIVSENIDKLSKLFPNCITESSSGKVIDFDQLKQELTADLIEGNKERYRLEWPGKKEAIVTANLPSNKTLRPIKADSVDFDATENIYIEGDNLEVLKLLQESYLGKIKVIYIDPPYNTGNDFVYKDNFVKDKDEELFESGQKDGLGQRLVVNFESSGRYHSDWLSMIYPRLKLARNLLEDDGLIFISINDIEVHNLKKICDEIFSESSFIEQFVVRSNPRGNQAKKFVASEHEYILCYCKNIRSMNLLGFIKNEEEFNKEDEGGIYREIGLRKRGAGSKREEAPNQYYPIYFDPDTKLITTTKNINYEEILPKLSDGSDGRWRWAKSTVEENKNKLIVRGVKRSKIIEYDVFEKDYFSEDKLSKIKSIFYEKEVNNENATEELKLLFDTKVFDYPKPTYTLKKLFQSINGTSFTVLDFFSGSATAADSLMQTNADDQGFRKYILVQLPELTDEKSESDKAGYKNICEIGKERIRRAAKKIKEETNADIDYGFRVYRLSESNMQDVYYHPQDYDQSKIDMFADNVKPDRTSDDLLTQIMLDWGLPLNLKIENIQITGKQVYKVNGDSLYACFDKGLDENFAKEIAKGKPLRIVFRDNSFKDNSAKTNVKQLLKQLSPETEMKVI
jgi:adenine-specific DNA-methyltransferase